MEHRYAVYGMLLRSDIPFDFPEETDAEGTASHVSLARGGDDLFDFVPPIGSSEEGALVCEARADRSVYLRSGSFYDFVIDADGKCIRYRALRDGEPSVLQNFIVGQALSVAMVLQGIEPLHAAVVDIAGEAIALLGDCTFGKSTLAASFLQTGHRLVTDDLLVVRERDGELVAVPGTCRLKLQPDSARAMLSDTAAGRRLNASTEKRVFRLDTSVLQRREVPMRAFFVLPTPEERARSIRIDVRRLSRAEVFHRLVTNTFVTQIENRDRLHQNFSWNSRLAECIDGYHLSYPPGIERLPDVRTAVLEQLSGDREKRGQ